jgi:hypothetical protein
MAYPFQGSGYALLEAVHVEISHIGYFVVVSVRKRSVLKAASHTFPCAFLQRRRQASRPVSSRSVSACRQTAPFRVPRYLVALFAARGLVLVPGVFHSLSNPPPGRCIPFTRKACCLANLRCMCTHSALALSFLSCSLVSVLVRQYIGSWLRLLLVSISAALCAAWHIYMSCGCLWAGEGMHARCAALRGGGAVQLS